MSIKNKRIEYFTEQILKENLQKGILPDSREFIWQLNQALRAVDGDKKGFHFRPYRNTEVLSSLRINKDNQKIYDDLFILYANIGTIHQLLNKQYTYFSIERDKLEKEIDALENRLRQITQNARRAGLLAYSYDTFDDTRKVNTYDTDNVFVDTQHNAVHLVEEKNTSRRIAPDADITFTFEPKDIEKKEETLGGQLKDILKEENDITWQKQYLLPINTGATGTLTVAFERIHRLNHIDLSVFTVKEMGLSVQYTPDGMNWYHLPYHEQDFDIEKKVALDFPSVDIKGVAFTFSKKEYDENLPEGDGYNFQYLFGIEELAFYQKAYPTQGVLYSKALEMHNVPEHYIADTLTLHTDEFIPTHTDIKYEIGIESDRGIDWQPISPMNRKHPLVQQTINLHRLTRNEKTELFFPEDFSIRQSEADDLLKNGIPLYRLSSIHQDKQRFELPKIQMIEGTTRLYVGRNSFEVMSYPQSGTGAIRPSDFEGVYDGLKTTYLPIDQARSGAIFSQYTDDQTRRYRVRCGVYVEKGQTITASPISTEQVGIYLNGERLYEGMPEGNQSIHYVFQSGWNELVVFVNGQGNTSVNGMTVQLGFNLSDVGSALYSSSQSLKEISVFDLQYNTKMHDHTVFAKRETETGLEILTNFGQPGLQFDLHYDYKDSIEEDRPLYLRAHFERENGENVPSPILRQYRIEYS